MICISAGNIGFEKLIEVVSQYDLVELRLDLLKLTDDEYSELLKYPQKLIITCRIDNENRDYTVQSYEKAAESGVRFIDIDLGEVHNFKSLIDNIENKITGLIISHHDFDKTPDLNEINNIVSKMEIMKPDIYKLCFKATGIEDIIRTLSIYGLYPKNQMVAFNLGDIGTLSRILALKAGAPFMYAAYDEDSKTEMSQLTHNQLRELLKVIE